MNTWVKIWRIGTEKMVGVLALKTYDKASVGEQMEMLAWLRTHVDNDIGWVKSITAEEGDNLIVVHVHCNAELYFGFKYDLEQQKVTTRTYQY